MNTQSESRNHSQTHSHAEPEPRTRRCRHIFAAGHQCGSPCLRTEQFCYFHHTTRRPVSDPKTRRIRATTYDLPVPEDRDSIRAAIAQVMHDIANNHIDLRRAGLLLYSLQTALCALPKEPRMSAQTVAISAAARPASRRTSHRKSSTVIQLPAESVVEDTIVDKTYGLIAPETFLHPEIEEVETGEWEDPGDEVLESGRLLRNTLGYKLLKDVELYECGTQGWHRGRVEAFQEAARAAAAAADRGATAIQTAETLAQAATKAAAEEAAFKAKVAAHRAKCRFYSGNDPDDEEEDAEDAAIPELEPRKSTILPNLNASAESQCLCHSRRFICHSRRKSAFPTPQRLSR